MSGHVWVLAEWSRRAGDEVWAVLGVYGSKASAYSARDRRDETEDSDDGPDVYLLKVIETVVRP